ncbi:MAG: hypothetical protein ACOYMD_12210 [Paludibacter sp.]
MKKLNLVALILGFVVSVNAQSTLSISGGIKSTKTEPTTMTLWYVDESPSRDNIYKDIRYSGNYSADLSLRIQENDINKNFNIFFEGQGYIGSILGFAFHCGYYYSGISEGNFRIRPELSAMLGYCKKDIGTIENNSVYIQVNKTQFQDYSNVGVSLQNLYAGLRPGISFSYKVGDISEIGLRINYQLSYKLGTLNFSGTGQDGEHASESEDLGASNVGFYINGQKTANLPFNPDGLEIKLFYGF